MGKKALLPILFTAVLLLPSMAFAAEPQIIDFSTMPDYIKTNIDAFPVTGRVPETTQAVYINGASTHFDSSVFDFFSVVDLSEGANTITVRVVDSSGSEANYSKQVEFDPDYSTAEKELVYARALHCINPACDDWNGSTIVVDVKNNVFLGALKEKNLGEMRIVTWPEGITRDGSEIIVTYGKRLSTASHADTGKAFPEDGHGRGSYLFSRDNKYVYYSASKVSLASNAIEETLPRVIGETASIAEDDKKIFLPEGYIDLEAGSFSAVNYSAGSRDLGGGIAASPNSQYILRSSYSWATGRLNVLNANDGSLLKQFDGSNWIGDYTGDIVFSPDGRWAYAGSYGNTYYGQGGILIVDMQNFDSARKFELHGPRSLAMGSNGKLYASAFYTRGGAGLKGNPAIRGIVELVPIDGGAGLEISKVFFVDLEAPFYGYYDKGALFYKPGSEIACRLDSDCGTDGFIGGNFCQNDSVNRNYVTYTCSSPGTQQASCLSSTTAKPVESCYYGCNLSTGACNQQLPPSAKPRSAGKVKVIGRNLFVDGREFTGKGIGYAPVPIGSNPEWGYDVTAGANSALWQRDFPLLRAMNANSIRTWGKVASESFLDAAWNNGEKPIRVIMGYWMGTGRDYQNESVRQTILADFNSYVRRFKSHPAVLVWAIGNEENYFYAGGNNAKHAAYFSLVNQMAQNAYQIEGAAYHPVMAVSLEMPGQMNTVGNAAGGSDDASIPYIDIWGINHYPGSTFGSFFDSFSSHTAKPLLVTEYGIDAWNNQAGTEHEETQADWDAGLWREIAAANVAVGGSLMAYSDEWWKDYGGSVSQHDYGGYPTSTHPDGYSNEEWWGVMRTADNGAQPDIMQPRKVYHALQQEFGKPGQGLVPLYRLWSAQWTDHFYTTSEGEKNNAASAGWKYEGIEGMVYAGQQAGTVPLYRFWHAGIGDHFYTTNEGEKNNLLKYQAWKHEGTAGYVYPTQVLGTTPLYRMWNSRIGDHFYTTSANQKNSLESKCWKLEGIAGHIKTTQVQGTLPLYRFWHAGIGDHFYTTNEGEKNTLLNSPAWKFEGTAGYLYGKAQAGTAPLYRFWNGKIGDHFYTTNEAEKNNVMNAPGWKYEGTAGYINTQAQADTKPLYRMWNPAIADHFYTTNEGEKNNVLAACYKTEGTAGYIYPAS